MTPVQKRPIPAWIWAVFGGMVLLACVCLALALLVGGRLRDLGPERHGNREGYTQVARPAHVPEPVANIGFDAWMAGSGLATYDIPADATVTPSVPLDVPALPAEQVKPTEVPPVQGRKAEVFPVREVSPVAITAMPDNPAWLRHAVSVSVPPGAPMLAIVLDDMGGDMAASRRAVEELPAGVTLSFFPWSRPGIALAKEARDDGHEIMIHMPMEALPHAGNAPDPGPDTLRVGMSPDMVESLLARNVARLADLAVGVNNHMGSRFTGWEEGMRAVLTVLQREGMLFLDSKTSAPTATAKAAQGLDLPILTRNVFLDHVPTPEAVRAELKKAVVLARKRGHALAIGHPLPVTLDVLRDELPRLVSSGIVLVPATRLVQDRR